MFRIALPLIVLAMTLAGCQSTVDDPDHTEPDNTELTNHEPKEPKPWDGRIRVDYEFENDFDLAEPTDFDVVLDVRDGKIVMATLTVGFDDTLTGEVDASLFRPSDLNGELRGSAWFGRGGPRMTFTASIDFADAELVDGVMTNRVTLRSSSFHRHHDLLIVGNIATPDGLPIRNETIWVRLDDRLGYKATYRGWVDGRGRLTALGNLYTLDDMNLDELLAAGRAWSYTFGEENRWNQRNWGWYPATPTLSEPGVATLGDVTFTGGFVEFRNPGALSYLNELTFRNGTYTREDDGRFPSTFALDPGQYTWAATFSDPRLDGEYISDSGVVRIAPGERIVIDIEPPELEYIEVTLDAPEGMLPVFFRAEWQLPTHGYSYCDIDPGDELDGRTYRLRVLKSGRPGLRLSFSPSYPHRYAVREFPVPPGVKEMRIQLEPLIEAEPVLGRVDVQVALHEQMASADLRVLFVDDQGLVENLILLAANMDDPGNPRGGVELQPGTWTAWLLGAAVWGDPDGVFGEPEEFIVLQGETAVVEFSIGKPLHSPPATDIQFETLCGGRPVRLLGVDYINEGVGYRPWPSDPRLGAYPTEMHAGLAQFPVDYSIRENEVRMKLRLPKALELTWSSEELNPYLCSANLTTDEHAELFQCRADFDYERRNAFLWAPLGTATASVDLWLEQGERHVIFEKPVDVEVTRLTKVVMDTPVTGVRFQPELTGELEPWDAPQWLIRHESGLEVEISDTGYILPMLLLAGNYTAETTGLWCRGRVEFELKPEEFHEIKLLYQARPHAPIRLKFDHDLTPGVQRADWGWKEVDRDYWWGYDPIWRIGDGEIVFELPRPTDSERIVNGYIYSGDACWWMKPLRLEPGEGHELLDVEWLPCRELSRGWREIDTLFSVRVHDDSPWLHMDAAHLPVGRVYVSFSDFDKDVSVDVVVDVPPGNEPLEVPDHVRKAVHDAGLVD